MSWREGLSEDQIEAASHLGMHARVLAGPGTGKTLTLSRRVRFLVESAGVDPENMLVLTFTRAAAAVLREQVEEQLGAWEAEMPRVSTLHSFALRQIVRNQNLVVVFPQPLRIADDWEERNIIQEDLKRLIDSNVKEVREKFKQLSADWETLNAESQDWEQLFPDPRFLGAWLQHRRIYGYTLRSELVYQLKRALEQIDDLALESDYRHVLVDEYQDLNKCDLEIMRRIAEEGAELFVAGDDDQSIYGFRYAHPEGIRRFCDDYSPSAELTLRTCHRCDRKILELGLFVANLDPQRVHKPLGPRDDAAEGEVHLLRFHHENHEATGVAAVCNHLLNEVEYSPRDILVLMRSDRNRVFSNLLVEHCSEAGVPMGLIVDETPPLDTDEGRLFASLLRLSVSSRDHLAYRSALALRANRLGETTFRTLYGLSEREEIGFLDSVEMAINDSTSRHRFRRILAAEHGEIMAIVQRFRETLPVWSPRESEENLREGIQELARDIIEDEERRNAVTGYLTDLIEEVGALTVTELLDGLTATVGDVEQKLLEDKISVLTMHRAKGLTADAVVIIAADDELIPGPNKEGDERRLLYVSLTRAKHHLFITYSTRRYGAQRFSGRERGSNRHTLTRFLRDAPLRPKDGRDFAESISE